MGTLQCETSCLRFRVTIGNVKHMIRSPAQIIEDKGGAQAFADRVGITVSNARVWKHRDKFPRGYWPDITVAYPDLDQDALLAAEEAGRKAA